MFFLIYLGMGKYFKVKVIILVLLISISTNAQDISDGDDLFSMSLEELMNVEVYVGTNAKLKKSQIPVSVTTITSEDIAHAPARTLLDILEIYVPNLLWLTHSENSKLGMRGVISDRQNKLILRVNGVIMNQKAHNGVTAELEHWDLNDIEKIDVIRGPGSVTYGPGAIMGIIDITTKNADSSEGIEVSTSYNLPYNSKGIGISQSHISENFTIFNYASIQRTTGYQPMAYKVNTDGSHGYIGYDFESGANANPVNFYHADFMDIPQIKLHSQMTFGEGWDLFARYTRAGATTNGSNAQVRLQTGFYPDSSILLSNELINYQQTQNQHFTTSLSKSFYISDKLKLKGRLTYDNETQIRARSSFAPTQTLSDDVTERDIISVLDYSNSRHWGLRFSEREITAEALTNYALSYKSEIAIGVSYTYNTWGPHWGEDDRSLRMGDKSEMVSDSLAEAVGNYTRSVKAKDAVYVGSGWSTGTFSTFGDLKVGIGEKFNVLFSGRVDKDDYSKWLVSPRLALISDITSKDILKLIAQKSLRMNTAEQLYLQNEAGVVTDPEELTSVEIMYNRLQTEKLNINLSGYYNQIELLGFNHDELNTTPLGNLQFAGVEVDIAYRGEKAVFGANHSYTHLVGWELDKDASSAGASYSDYNKSVSYNDDYGNKETVVLKGAGNSLNNWSNSISKLYVTYKVNEKLSCHVNSRVYWGFQGAKDGLTSLENAALTVDDSASVARGKALAAIEDIRNENAFDIDLRLNLSVTYQPDEKVDLALYAMNIYGTNSNKRYTYDGGGKQFAPHRVQFVEEPLSIGAKLTYRL